MKIHTLRCSVGLVLACLGFASGFAAEYQLTPDTDLKPLLKKVVAGDSIVLQDGQWKDADLKFELLQGTEDAPICIRPQTPGKVVLTGECQFRVSGQYVIVSGLVFRDPQGVSDVVQFRTHSQRHAHHCRLTDCVIEEGEKSDAGRESRWLSIYGSGNRVDHCYFAGKKNRGSTVVIWVAKDHTGNRLDHNHFGPRPKLNKNGGETIRIGTSDVSEMESNTIVENNYFHRCNGEAEAISNKSCGNVYRHNVFDAVSGTLTLRHGHRCRVQGNVFMGREQSGTGGVRIIGDSHVVVNNYFEGLRGDAERAALSMMNGVPNSPLNEYSPVRRAVISHNTFVNCKVSLEIGVGAGKKQTVAPADCHVTHNIFVPGKWELSRVHAIPIGFTWKSNLQQSGKVREHALKKSVEFDSRDFALKRGADDLLRPTTKSDIRTDIESEVKADIDGDLRQEASICGCDEPTETVRKWVSAETSGPTWMK